jgi:purine-binding chemotaxis protein CheW
MAQVGQFVARSALAEAPADSACLVFRAGRLLAAVRLGEVAETMRPLPVRPLAGTAPYVRGVALLRGRPAPVVDVARLLAGESAATDRFVAVRTGRGPVALATGEVLGVRHGLADVTAHGPDDDAGDEAQVQQNTALLGPAPGRLVAAIGALDGEPVFVLRNLGMVPDDVWTIVQSDSALPGDAR